MKLGQTSIEFLLILSIALFVITGMILLTQQHMGDIGHLKDQDDAKNSLLDISSAAKDVYSQGEGAKKKVYIRLPNSYDPSASSIGGQGLVINVMGTDFASVEDFDVHGSWPGTSGGHWVWVISEGNKVRIGSAMIGLSKNSIYRIMEQNSTDSVSFYIESLWDQDISVDATVVWNNPDVALVISDTSFPLTPGEKKDIDLDFSTNSDAFGYQTGEIIFFAEDGVDNETVRLPITIEVAGYRSDIPPPLNVTPDFWAETLSPGNSTTRSFQVCTNIYTSVSGVTFTPSSGNPGAWVGNTGSLGPQGAGTCQNKILSLDVPIGTPAGTYNGQISVVGTGAVGAQDTISLFIVIADSGNGTQTCAVNDTGACNCPVGSAYWGVALCNCQPATIYVQNGIIVGGPDNGLPYTGTLRGGSGTDIIAGTNGSDIIYTGTGGDRVCGHEGDDTIYGDNSDDNIDGGPGNDIIYGQSGGDILYGKDGDDTIYGSQGNDQIDGGNGDDYIDAGTGDDLVYGGPGNDIIYGNDGKDTICGNAGQDSIYGEVNNDLLDGGSGTDSIDGGINSDDCYRGETYINCESTPGGELAVCGPS